MDPLKTLSGSCLGHQNQGAEEEPEEEKQRTEQHMDLFRGGGRGQARGKHLTNSGAVLKNGKGKAHGNGGLRS